MTRLTTRHHECHAIFARAPTISKTVTSSRLLGPPEFWGESRKRYSVLKMQEACRRMNSERRTAKLCLPWRVCRLDTCVTASNAIYCDFKFYVSYNNHISNFSRSNMLAKSQSFIWGAKPSGVFSMSAYNSLCLKMVAIEIKFGKFSNKKWFHKITSVNELNNYKSLWILVVRCILFIDLLDANWVHESHENAWITFFII